MMAIFYVTSIGLLFIPVKNLILKRNRPVIPPSNMIFIISSGSTLRPPTGVEECQIEMETYHNTNSRVINVQPYEQSQNSNEFEHQPEN